MTAQAGIQKTNQAFSAAMAAGDAEGVAACYTEDGLFLSTQHPHFKR
ncbi:MAG: hypothetical protein P8J14_09030 [Emcibacteraceae bacterium]|nr:hypothetical protein [Emcibacteraceae bacterium]